jgi:hypothetical protein
MQPAENRIGSLLTHPAGMLAAAIGEPDAKKGEMPVAYVQLRLGTTVRESELLAHFQREITERAAAPRAVWILAEMPIPRSARSSSFRFAIPHRSERCEIIAPVWRGEGSYESRCSASLQIVS